jgi:hypothetical protein
MVNTGDIALEVDYQRDVVWTGQSPCHLRRLSALMPVTCYAIDCTEARQEGLIDSLFLNYFIPPVLVHSIHLDRNDTLSER